VSGSHQRNWFTPGILAISGILLACATERIPSYPSIQLAPDRQALLVTFPNQSTLPPFTLQNLPAESTIAPGLFFRPQRFAQVLLSPDRRHVAFSTEDHHTLVGLLDLTTMAVQEIDIISEGEVVAFHWSDDSRTLAYDYLPAGGYRRVKAYDIQTGESLFVPRDEGKVALHITFEAWGSQPRDVLLSILDIRTNNRQMNTVTLGSRK
jgi:hypothetical protein